MKNGKKGSMTKDCNGCFGAAGDDCQKCQEVDEVTPPKPDITPELAIAAYNTLIDYCKQFDSRSNCGNCIFDQICYPESDETVCTLNFYHICPADWDKITLPSLNGNTVTYIKRWPAQKSNLWTARRSSRVLRGGKACTKTVKDTLIRHREKL